MTRSRLTDRQIGEVARGWWTDRMGPTKGDPGARAQLRRARNPAEALFVPAARDLAGRMGVLPRGPGEGNGPLLERALDLARVLAHVADPDGQPPMREAGWRAFPGERKESEAGEDRPRLSEARFRRLLQEARGEGLVEAFVRLLRLLDGKVDIATLAPDFWWWNDRVRERWAYDYYRAEGAAPPAATRPDGGEE